MTITAPSRSWRLNLGAEATSSGVGFTLEQLPGLLQRLHLFAVAQQLPPHRRAAGEEVASVWLEQGTGSLAIFCLPTLVFVVASQDEGQGAQVLDESLSASEVLWLTAEWLTNPQALESLSWRTVRRTLQEVSPFDWLFGAGLRPDLGTLGRSQAPVAAGVFRARAAGWTSESQKITVLTRLSWEHRLDEKVLEWRLELAPEVLTSDEQTGEAQ